LLLLLWQLMVAMTTTPHPRQSHAECRSIAAMDFRSADRIIHLALLTI